MSRQRPKVSVITIAERAGVGKSTAARVLSGQGSVSDETRERVLAAARALQYRPNTAARSLRRGENRWLGVVAPHTGSRGVISYVVHAQKLEGMARGARRLGYDLSLFIEDVHDAEALRSLVASRDVQALLFLSEVPRSTLALLERYQVRFVAVNWRHPARPHDAHVWTDFEHAGHALCQHLASSGCRRLLAFNWIPAAYGAFDDGIRRAWKEAGRSASALELHSGSEFYGGAAVVSALERAFASSERPDGILTGNESAALSAYRVLAAKGLRPGRDVAIATYDELEAAVHVDPPLTTFAQPTYDLGEAAVELVDAVLRRERRAPRARRLSGQLNVRESTAAFVPKKR